MQVMNTIVAACCLLCCAVASLCGNRYADDTLAVRAILDANGHQAIPVADVTIVCNGRIVVLDLSNAPLKRYVFSISVIPPAIGQLTALKVLNAGSNHLAVIPEEVCFLSMLERLDLTGNLLASVPGCIGNLDKLKYLSLSANVLTFLPSAIAGLSGLQVLECGYNKLDSIPHSIGALKKLVRLHLQSNALRTIPPEAGRLGKLAELDLSANRLASLPDSLINLAGLNALYCHDNELCKVPTLIERWASSINRQWRADQRCATSEIIPDSRRSLHPAKASGQEGAYLLNGACASKVKSKYTGTLVKVRFGSSRVLLHE